MSFLLPWSEMFLSKDWSLPVALLFLCFGCFSYGLPYSTLWDSKGHLWLCSLQCWGVWEWGGLIVGLGVEPKASSTVSFCSIPLNSLAAPSPMLWVYLMGRISFSENKIKKQFHSQPSPFCLGWPLFLVCSLQPPVPQIRVSFLSPVQLFWWEKLTGGNREHWTALLGQVFQIP